ncbi:MAG: hypothetical protein VST70_05370 [Nitrospirota bacterium]|nr:hypothetical protein [Nitrospirota bacterium]
MNSIPLRTLSGLVSRSAMIDTVWLDPIPNPPGDWLRGMEPESMSRPVWEVS